MPGREGETETARLADRHAHAHMHRYKDTQVQGYTGTRKHRYKDTQVHGYTDTRIHRYKDTQLGRSCRLNAGSALV